MAKVLSFVHTDTPISGVTSNTVDLPLVNFGADFRVESNQANELILTNLRSPLGDPEKFRSAFSVVSNIYKNTDIEPSSRSQNPRGVSLLLQHTDIASVTDSTDATFLQKKPFEAHIVVKVPADEVVTADIVKGFLLRTICAAFESGSNTSARLNAELRGSLLPADMK